MRMMGVISWFDGGLGSAEKRILARGWGEILRHPEHQAEQIHRQKR